MHRFYVINICPAKNMWATLDILKIFSFKLGAQGLQFVKKKKRPSKAGTFVFAPQRVDA